MHRRRTLLVAITVTTLAGWVAPATAGAAGGSFVDDDRSRFQPFIETAVAAGLVSGCNPPVNDRFCPNRVVTRGEMAMMLARAVGLPPAHADYFTDDDGLAAERAIDSLAEAGITGGCGDQVYCPGRPLTRGEMATLIVRALGWDPIDGPGPYTDLADSPYGPALATLAAKGALEPCDEPIGSRMCPRSPVRRDEAAFALTTALGLAPVTVGDGPVPGASLGFADGFQTLELWDGRAPSSRNRVTLTDAGYGGNGLRVDIPRGSHFGADFELDLGKAVGEDPEILFFRYYLRLDPDWAPVSSGKLPGFSGVYNYTGKGGYRSSPSAPGWSARMEFFGTAADDDRARLGYYVYHLGQEGRYGDGMAWNEAGKLQPGEWYCVEGEVQMNTPGLSDGALRAWVDGTPAFDASGIAFRRPGEPDIRIDSFWFNVYYGGKKTPETPLGLTIDEVAVDTRRIGCGESDVVVAPVQGDFNGDGFSDQAWWGVCPGGWCFQLQPAPSTGALANPRLDDGAWFSLETARLGIGAGDFDGDGRDDLLYRGRCEGSVRCWRVHLSAGTYFESGENWGDGARFDTTTDRLVIGDWNGDGLDDIAYRGICGSDPAPCWRAHLSVGDRFGDPMDWGPPPAAQSTAPETADLDGDGRDDLVFTAPCDHAMCWYAQLSTGSAFTDPTVLGAALPSELSWRRFFDFDADGADDLITTENTGTSGYLVSRSLSGARLADPVVVARSEGPVSDALLRRLGPGRPVEAIVEVACGDKTCPEPRTLLSGWLLSPSAYAEATEVPRLLAGDRLIPI